MQGRITTLSFITAMALAGAAMAQSDGSDGAAKTEQSGATDQSGASDQSGVTTLEKGLSTGEPANAGPQDDGTYTKETNGAWELRCARTDGERDPCQMYQLLKDDKDNPVAKFSLFRLPEGGKVAAGATVIVPLETLLTAQLTLAVDSNSPKRYPYSFCNKIGCYARIGLTADDVNTLKRGANAELTIVPFVAPDQKVTVDMSLSGFTATYGKVSILDRK